MFYIIVLLALFSIFFGIGLHPIVLLPGIFIILIYISFQLERILTNIKQKNNQ